MAMSTTLTVPAQSADDSRAMAIFQLEEGGVKALQFGRRVDVVIPMDGHSLYRLRRKPTLRALTKFFPAIARALYEHNAVGGGPITTVILPQHNVSAYQKLFGWMNASITAGKLVRVNRVNINAKFTYGEMKKISEDLGVGYVVKAMDGRMGAMARSAGQ